MKRNFETIPLNVVIDRFKRGLSPAPEKDGKEPIFILSPNDLVYVPTSEELTKTLNSSTINYDRIYKMVSATGNRAFYIKFNIANSIIDKFEFSPLNKMERSLTGEMIKEVCIPIKVDRLGNINTLKLENLVYNGSSVSLDCSYRFVS